MTAHKRNPTNADVIKRLDKMEASFSDVIKDVGELKDWRIAIMAVDEYKRREGDSPATAKSPNDWLNRELIKMFGVALGIIMALVVLSQSLAK